LKVPLLWFIFSPMELQAAYFLKYFKRQQFQYQDPHYLIDFRVAGIKPYDLRPFSYFFNFNIVCTRVIIRNYMTGEYDTPTTKIPNVRRTNLYIRIDGPSILRSSFYLFEQGTFPYRIIINNIRWDLK